MANLSAMESDFLKELANIGVGHAASSLGDMVKAKVDISLPTMSIISLQNIIGMRNENFCAVTTGILGDIKGMLVVLFSDKTSFWLIDKMYENPQGTTKEYSKEGKEAMTEFCNIIGGSFLTSLSNFLQLDMMPKLPKIVAGKGYEVKDRFQKFIEEEVKDVLSVKTELFIERKRIEGEIYLVLDKESFEKIFKKAAGMNI